jgi:hypothetical protein
MVKTRQGPKKDREPSPTNSASKSSSRALHPARTNKKGLENHLQKQLLQDIENCGGIGDEAGAPFNLKAICNRRPELYGESGSQLRDKIGDKVQAWRKLTRPEYLKLLEHFGVWGSQLSSPIPAVGLRQQDKKGTDEDKDIEDDDYHLLPPRTPVSDRRSGHPKSKGTPASTPSLHQEATLSRQRHQQKRVYKKAMSEAAMGSPNPLDELDGTWR